MAEALGSAWNSEEGMVSEKLKMHEAAEEQEPKLYNNSSVSSFVLLSVLAAEFYLGKESVTMTS